MTIHGQVLMRLMQYLCVELVKFTSILFEQCALMHVFFGNNRGVHVLEHVR